MAGILLNNSKNLIKSCIFARRFNICSIGAQQLRNKSQIVETNVSENNEQIKNDEPITYTKSKAFTYKASQNFRSKSSC